MIRITIDVSGKDAVFISNCYRYHSGLCGLELYRNPPEQLPKTDKLKELIDNLQQAFEGGANGNHADIAKRNKARKELSEIFKKIASYLQSVATEDDIPALIQAGFGIGHGGGRKKSAPLPAT